MQPLQLRIQLFQAAAVIRHVVSAGTAFLPAQLDCHNAADLFGVVAIAGAGALQLQFFRYINQQGTSRLTC